MEESIKLAEKRVTEISKEFKEGFEFLANYPKSITFFGGNQIKEDNPYYNDAKTLASRLVTELGYAIVTGGGPGIMEAANRGAYESGGTSIGLLIQLPDGQVTNRYITKSFALYYFFIRKVCLSFSAEAFIFYPGGFGTLDEFFEILTLVQTKKIVGVPMICVGSEYWNKLKSFMVEEMEKRGTIAPGDMDLFHIRDSHDEIIEIAKTARVRVVVPITGLAE
ncbi:MAG: Rossman fold protein, TIGR00730 family [Candidatus Zambryskibacteria bacterium RIFCSPHIGHO2_01_FULL_44_22b]|uniref:Cytokinin riboside 5'-monophosphate phosphoribohydrolase n=2 Tax=Candidatus Zambryskiibacteriota TaxID=1817925 RepID=A0A1G2SYP0_9BACT|nr:MAG: Rossman fold protein, TIGR00730 family [Candidatus Zambryskibacteria bacterium RIFCSPHIGHO2_01_FULL_44_22b]OHB04896.1 MAG: Rossman fold protein, TIGR00730 family [Candidatus Zambryskibacteria bacterium RIFCSPLOWO2_01_FULL_45_43]